MTCSRFQSYAVWMQNRPDRGYCGPWRRTGHAVKARTDGEAQSKMRRKFAGFGLSACALIALPDGIDANAGNERLCAQGGNNV
jgi:hypothetical protein